MDDQERHWQPEDADLASKLPSSLALGVATSAYQIEGAAGGRGASIWDTFAAAGRIAGRETGRVACDHVTRWQEDLDLLAELGIRHYRLSVSWPRLQPAGAGPLTESGVRFYRDLLTGLAERDIRPWVTLYHWELPQPLEDAGGWPERATSYRFADFVGSTVEALGDLVSDWITLNEPWCSAFLGYGTGEHAPGRTSVADAVAAAHHLNLAHGLATERIRGQSPGARIGITNVVTDLVPATDSSADRAAARRLDAQHNRLFLGPVYQGAYDDEVLDLYGDFGLGGGDSVVREGDLEVISQPTDFVGVNHYHRFLVSHAAAADNHLGVHTAQPDLPLTTMGWAVCPDSLHDVLRRVAGDYSSLPIVITENGAAYPDQLGADDRVDDPARIAYLRGYLAATARAIESGVDVRGYFVWSLLDNFEWAAGYEKRFGLVYVDYPTQRRIPKASAQWYRRLIQQRGQTSA